MKNKLLKIGILLAGVCVLTSCTKSFATVQDKVNTLSTYERAVSDDNAGYTNLEVIIQTVEVAGYHTPSDSFFDYIEEKVATTVKENYDTIYYLDDSGAEKSLSIASLSSEDLLDKTSVTYSLYVKSNEYALVKYAKEKTETEDDLWSNYNKWLEEAKDVLPLDEIGSSYYHTTMQSTFNTYQKSITTYITPEDMEYNGIYIQGKSWGEAFSYGLIEGLLVWPIAALLYYLAMAFSSLGTAGIVLAIFIVTLIVRGILLLATFKQTMSQTKMTALQPELAKIQEKYPNANTNEYEKQRLSQEQMELYKKNKINPFGMIITLVIQYPIFIAVWGAMSGSAILVKGTLFGLQLSAATGQSIINWQGQSSVVALVLFIIMALVQAVAMLLPQFLQKKRTQNVAKMGKNPAADQNNSTMKMMNIVMLVMIIFMGFQLPVAMSIYWIISAVITLVQNLIMQAITSKKTNNKKPNYKTAKVK